MTGLLFGTGGTPHSARSTSTISGIERIAELGLGCMEIEFVQGVRMGEQSALAVAEIATRRKIRLTAHAPYFINLNARDPDKIEASQRRLWQTAHIARLCHAESIAFHAAFYMGDSPEETYKKVKKHLGEVVNQLKQENNKVWIRPEVSGKVTQFGTLDEILNLCTELEGVAPCIDFAHWHARSGNFNSYPEFAFVLEQVQKRLGREALDSMHMHVSGISFSRKAGELKHLNLKEADLHYDELLQALKDHGAKGMVVCESPNLEEDALLLQATYSKV